MIDLKDRKVSIIGARRSGIASAEIVLKYGGIPFVSDSGDLSDTGLDATMQRMGVKFEFGRHTDAIYDCEIMIISPGVPSDSEIVVNAKARGITVWPEIELGYRICRGTIVGVTGSNGKTTVTTLIGEILREAGFNVTVCGNIGRAFVALADDIPDDGYAVVELSSFQLEMIDHFHPHVAVFMNITPDHLDRHGSFKNYLSAKMKIFANQTESDHAVVNYDDARLRECCSDLQSRVHWFSTEKRLKGGVWGRSGGELYNDDDAIMKSSDLKIKGIHNLSNACAATAATLSLGVDKKIIVNALTKFPGVEHRLEPVRLIGGVSFVNDSKGTNVDSVRWALMAISTPIILIAGGKDKDGDFSALNDLIERKVKKVILIGQAAGKICKTWSDLTVCESADDLHSAVRAAYAYAVAGDTVLLSPGCASFDMFDNYEHRGKVFKEAVQSLNGKEVRQ